MKRVNLLLAAAISAALIGLVELIGAAPPPWSGLANSPWPWFSFAGLIGAIGTRPRGRHTARIAIISLSVAGLAAAERHRFRVANAPFSAVEGPISVEGRVDSNVSRTPKSVRFALDTGDARVLVVVSDAARELKVAPGDAVALWGSVANAPTYATPGAAPPVSSRALRAGGFAALVFSRARDVRVGPHRTAFSVRRVAHQIQQRASSLVAARGGDSAGNAIVRALAAGDRGAISPTLSLTLRDAGIAHLLAVSGLHLAVVAVFLFAICRRLWLLTGAARGRLEAHTAAAVVALFGVLIYTLVTGARPSTLRALFVAAIVFAGLATFRRARALDALGAAALVLVSFRPSIIFDPSFQMSMAAAIALSVAFARRQPHPSSRLRRVIRTLRDLVAIAALALLATAPTAIGLYEQVSLVGIVLNVVAVPLVELVVLPFALLGVLLSALSPAVGGLPLDLAIACSGWIARLSEQAVTLFPPTRVPALSWYSIGLVVVASLGFAMAIRPSSRRRRRLAAILVALLALLAAAGLIVSNSARSAPDGLQVTFLDVGQGDAAVIEFPTGEVWLVDMGGTPWAKTLADGEGPGARSVVPFLRWRGIDRIDVAVISHAHPDHYLGLGAIALEVPIEAIIVAGEDVDQRRPPMLRALLLWLRLFGTDVQLPSSVDDVGAATVRFLAPRYGGSIAVDPVSSVNDNSIALRIDYGGRSILLAGDLEEEGEELLLEAAGGGVDVDVDVDVDVVKVNHHGSKTSSTSTWIAAVRAQFAVISCGRRNRFGFPHPDVVARWRASGAVIMRTDQLGTITVRVSPDGELETTSALSLPSEGGG